MSWDLNIVMEYSCLEFWMETSEKCCVVLMDEESSAPASQRVIYKKLQKQWEKRATAGDQLLKHMAC